MANFGNGPNPTNDPSYVGSSRGTDNASLQQLAQVPELNTKYVQPDYKANTSYGRLFEGLSEIGGSAVKATDAIIKKNINDSVNQGINDIRDSFGVAQAADRSSGLAQAAGAAGTETDSRLIPQKPEQPQALQRLGTKIDGLWEAYQNGNLSNSSYYAKMERFVRETKARYPGYGDDVDDMVKSKLGVTPANALRASLQDDVAKLAAKVQGQNDKWTTWERQNADVISLVYGSYENYQTAVANGQVARPQVEARVANFNAVQTNNKAALANLSVLNGQDDLRGKLTERVATSGINGVVDTTIDGMMQSVGFDPRKYIDDIAGGKRPLPSPEEKAAITTKMGQLRVNVEQAIDKYLDSQVMDASGHPSTARALMGDAKATALKASAMARIGTYEKTLIGDGDHSIMALDATLAKGRQDFAARRVGEMMPQLDVVKVMRDRVGDDLTTTLWQNSPNFTTPTLNSLSKMSWANIADGKYTLKATLNDYKNAGVNDANLNWNAIDTAKAYIQNPEKLKDKSVSENAVKFLFHPDNSGVTEQVLHASGPKGQLAFWTSMTDERTISKISKMDSKTKGMVTTWAEDEFPSVFNTTIDSASQAVENYKVNGNLSLKFDPQGARFYFEKSASAPRGLPQSVLSSANAKVEGLNTAIGSMKRIWDMNGQTDTLNQMYRFLIPAGIEQDNPIYKLLRDEVQKQEGERVKAANK